MIPQMNTHRIQRVAKLVGLSKDVIRVWEKRYGLVKPLRSANRYREYTDKDVALLRFLKQELDHGQTIGALAVEGRDALMQRMRTSSAATAQELKPHESLLDELTRCSILSTKPASSKNLTVPSPSFRSRKRFNESSFRFRRRVGDLWHEGKLNVAVEHYVTKLIQQKLFSVMNQLPIHEGGLHVVVACPEGESHEIGAQSAAYLAAVRGCHVYYLGPNLPIAELAAFCERVKPDLVLLSELRRIRLHASPRRPRVPCEEMACRHRWSRTHAIEPRLLEERNIELLDDLTALHNRVMTLFQVGCHFQQSNRIGITLLAT